MIMYKSVASLIYVSAGLLCCLLLAACEQPPRLQRLADDAVILAFGDSLTAGTGATSEQAYPSQLQVMTARTVINAGIPGEVSQRGLRRLPGLLSRYQPDLVIICHGGNDILRRLNLQQTRDNIQQMIDLSRAHGAQVVLLGVPEFGLFLSSAEFYTELADDNHVPIENTVLGDILKQAAYKSDQIHPNAAGYRLLAQKLVALLKKSDAI